MAIDAELAAELGIEVDSPLAQDATIDLNDPAMQELIKSFDQTAPTAREIADEIEAAQAADEAIDPDAPPESPEPEPLPAAAEDAPAADEPETPTPVSSFVVDLGDGATHEITTTDAKRLIGLDQWAQSLPPETVQAFDAIEQGRAVALPRDEWEAYLAFKAAGKPTTPATSLADVDLDEYTDPATRALHAEVQQLRQSIEAQRQDAINTQSSAEQARIQAHIDARSKVFETTFTSEAAAAGLTPVELNQALQYAMDSRTILAVNNELASYNPANGQLLQEADPSEVARVTLERAIYALPALRQRAIDLEVSKRIEVERADIIQTNEKRNRAGSLSSAPTAASTQEPVDVRNLSAMDLEAHIANEIRRTSALS